MKQLNVLCVDDEKNVLSSLKRVLHKEGYGLYFASSGQEAIDVCSNNHIDLIICDFKMPDMTGGRFYQF